MSAVQGFTQLAELTRFCCSTSLGGVMADPSLHTALRNRLAGVKPVDQAAVVSASQLSATDGQAWGVGQCRLATLSASILAKAVSVYPHASTSMSVSSCIGLVISQLGLPDACVPSSKLREALHRALLSALGSAVSEWEGQGWTT